jgi:adenine-specific DNA-methyltransferase
MRETRLYRNYAENRRYVLYRGDCLNLLKSLPDESIDLTITSPPYCLGKEYESTKDVEDFVSSHTHVLPEVIRVTKPGGSICWEVGYHVKNRCVIPLDYLVYEIIAKFPGIALRNRLIWTYGHGLHETERFSGRHEVVLWFTKGKDYYFNLDSVRIPQKYPGKRHYKGPKKGEFSGNPLGKNPSDVWEIPNVNAKHKEKTLHPCQFPVGLALRLVRALCPENGRVFDPFSGAGTTAAAAALSNRSFVGAEVNERYCKIAEERFHAALPDDYRTANPTSPSWIPRRPVAYRFDRNTFYSIQCKGLSKWPRLPDTRYLTAFRCVKERQQCMYSPLKPKTFGSWCRSIHVSQIKT